MTRSRRWVALLGTLATLLLALGPGAERAEAAVEITSRPGGGTRVAVVWPAPPPT